MEKSLRRRQTVKESTEMRMETDGERRKRCLNEDFLRGK